MQYLKLNTIKKEKQYKFLICCISRMQMEILNNIHGFMFLLCHITKPAREPLKKKRTPNILNVKRVNKKTP